MSLKKQLFISAVKLAKVDDAFIIPTILYYDQGRPRIGRTARERCPSPELLIEDFKVEIGNIDPDSLVKKSSIAAGTNRRTATGLAKDFLDESLKKINNWLDLQGLPNPTRILIAEPLSPGGSEASSDAWLANYRKSIKRALPSRYVEVDFLPEPFAAFQYYRYGYKHPIVAEQRRQVALVLDFGGGTFDASIIETTNSGDISWSGKNSRPLSAMSLKIGGFYLNRMIAEDALYSVLDKRHDKSSIRKSLEFFYENRNAGEDFIEALNDAQKAFFRNMRRLLTDVERAKISVSNSIANWHLDAELAGVIAYPINVPADPYSPNPQAANVRFDAAKLRNVYEERVWKPKLKPAIASTIERAKAELKGQEISVVLLSGGSSNIRWLRSLMERDLRNYLREAHIVELNENFQEIVAKGLATECARRFYTAGQGDFRAVTYNRLCLALKSDGGELEIRRLRPIGNLFSNRTDGTDVDEGVLLPAASSLRGLTDKPLRWKVRLSKAPKRYLEYYFLRSSFDPEDLEALHNVATTKVFTPTGTQFQQGIEIELTVREDGTAEPRFYYGRDNFHQGTMVEGKSFYMDMTFATAESPGETYLGFDFGTSTSACSFVCSDDVQLIEQRARSQDWRELAEVVADLPYPAAAPLARYISETDTQRRSDRGREAAEGLLTFAAYVAYAEYCTAPGNSAWLKGMPHRSAGPLWGLLKQCLKSPNQELAFSRGLRDLVEPTTAAQLDTWISEIAPSKHGKAVSVDYVSLLGVLSNTVLKSIGDSQFGVFQDVTAKRLSHEKFSGVFRSFHGSSSPFIRILEYEGSQSFSDAEVFLINPNDGVGIALSPLYFLGLQEPAEGVDPDVYEFDGARDDQFTFKTVQLRPEFSIRNSGEFSEVWQRLATMKAGDVKIPLVTRMKFESHDWA